MSKMKISRRDFMKRLGIGLVSLAGAGKLEASDKIKPEKKIPSLDTPPYYISKMFFAHYNLSNNFVEAKRLELTPLPLETLKLLPNTHLLDIKRLSDTKIDKLNDIKI